MTPISIKNDHKVIMALRTGIQDGIMNRLTGLKLRDHYYTKKESAAYYQGAGVTQETAEFDAYGNEIARLEKIIAAGFLKPIGWKISRCIDSGFRPFIEEV